MEERMITMTRRLEFDAGHRLIGHETKCKNAHGHRYVVEVEVALTAEGDLDHVGRIVDFGDVKTKLGAWLDEHLDHAFIANRADTATLAWLYEIGSKIHVVGFEPTAELLADYLLDVARRLLDGNGRHVVALTVYETPNCWAVAR
jgi:6-pyruvoyltetrahydropterin/6-carboxytetrahydropterin synthase